MRRVMSYAYVERHKAFRHLALCWFGCILGLWLLLWIFMPLSHLITETFSDMAWHNVGLFYKRTFNNPFVVWQEFFKWFHRFWMNEPEHYSWSSFIGWRLPLLPLFVFVMSAIYFMVYNPYDYEPHIFGYGREAKPADLKRMGLANGKYLYLGNLGNVKMHLPDTRSAFCIGAPSSGKTAGVIIPNILTADNACLFIHDPTGQLMKLTSGYRSTLGPVYNMDFSKADTPQEGVFYPCWNPLNEDNMPPQHAGRDSYIDGLVEFLIPDGPEGTDPYWVKSGRACLTGLTIYIANKVEQAKANDYFVARLDKGLDAEDLKVLLSYYKGMQPTDEVKRAIDAIEKNKFSKTVYTPIGTWDPMPKNWIGREASFGMLLDMLNNWMFTKTKELRKKRDEGDINAVGLDVWQQILDTMVNEIFYYGYSRRALLELNQVFALPDKQRASVLSMAQSGIELFKNSAIRERTSSNDFKYSDFRGRKNEKTGKWEPLTFYINNEGGAVCTLFINMISGALQSKGQNEGDMGPYAVEFILDDFGRMPKLQSIADGVTFGRSKGNIYLVCVQDWHQITAKYGEDTCDIILSSVAAKIIKRQNNPQTRDKVTAGIMKLTRIVEGSHGGERGFGKDVNIFVTKGGFKRIEDSTVGGTGILKMDTGAQLVLYAGHYHRPIQAKTPLYFKSESLKQKASMPTAENIPSDMLEQKKKQKRLSLEIQLDALTDNNNT